MVRMGARDEKNHVMRPTILKNCLLSLFVHMHCINRARFTCGQQITRRRPGTPYNTTDTCERSFILLLRPRVAAVLVRRCFTDEEEHRRISREAAGVEIPRQPTETETLFILL